MILALTEGLLKCRIISQSYGITLLVSQTLVFTNTSTDNTLAHRTEVRSEVPLAAASVRAGQLVYEVTSWFDDETTRLSFCLY